MEGNYVEYQPIVKENTKVKPKSKDTRTTSEKRCLKDIYNEFWEFIDDNNSEFKEFISKDKRRLKLKLKV